MDRRVKNLSRATTRLAAQFDHISLYTTLQNNAPIIDKKMFQLILDGHTCDDDEVLKNGRRSHSHNYGQGVYKTETTVR